MSKTDAKILKVEQQRSDLDQQLKDLKRQRNEDLLEILLKALDLFPDGKVPSKTIIGMFLEGLETATKESKKAEVWHRAGDTFCKRNGAKRSSKKTAPSSLAAA